MTDLDQFDQGQRVYPNLAKATLGQSDKGQRKSHKDLGRLGPPLRALVCAPRPTQANLIWANPPGGGRGSRGSSPSGERRKKKEERSQWWRSGAVGRCGAARSVGANISRFFPSPDPYFKLFHYREDFLWSCVGGWGVMISKNHFVRIQTRPK